MNSASQTANKRTPRSQLFKDQLAILFEEIELALKWQRPSILLAVYRTDVARSEAQATLTRRLHQRGQEIQRYRVTEKKFDIPLALAQHPEREHTVFYITGLEKGGGKDGFNAYRALNIRREYFVDYRIRAVLWLNEAEAKNLPHRAPDFWAFRHRVVEFIEPLVVERGVT